MKLWLVVSLWISWKFWIRVLRLVGWLRKLVLISGWLCGFGEFRWICLWFCGCIIVMCRLILWLKGIRCCGWFFSVGVMIRFSFGVFVCGLRWRKLLDLMVFEVSVLCWLNRYC